VSFYLPGGVRKSYRSAAWEILDDGKRYFIASPFLRLELLPKAKNRGTKDEVKFLEDAFSLVMEWVSVDDELVERAIELGIAHQLRNIDTVHAASAERVGCEQFVTSELPGKPYFRVVAIKAIKAINLLDAINP
jgi:predicted nucleic acid-binding protein